MARRGDASIGSVRERSNSPGLSKSDVNFRAEAVAADGTTLDDNTQRLAKAGNALRCLARLLARSAAQLLVTEFDGVGPGQ